MVQGQLQFSAQFVDKKGEPIGDPGQGAPTLGFIWDDFKQLSPWTLDSGRPPRADDEVVIDKGSADKGNFKVGDEVNVLTQTAPAKYKVVGIAKFGTADNPGGASVTLFTQAQAQAIAGAPDQFDGIAVGGEDGVSQAELASRIRAAIDLPKIQVITGDQLTKENQDQIQKNLSFFNTFLLIFALVALFVGCFIIFNTFSIIVAQRTKEMALLRAIGASGRQVMASVLGEAFVVGFLASAVGLGLGILLASGLKVLLERRSASTSPPAARCSTPEPSWSRSSWGRWSRSCRRCSRRVALRACHRSPRCAMSAATTPRHSGVRIVSRPRRHRARYRRPRRRAHQRRDLARRRRRRRRVPRGGVPRSRDRAAGESS